MSPINRSIRDEPAPQAARAELTAGSPTSCTARFVASFEETVIMRRSTACRGMAVPGEGMPASRSPGSKLKVSPPPVPEGNVWAAATG